MMRIDPGLVGAIVVAALLAPSVTHGCSCAYTRQQLLDGARHVSLARIVRIDVISIDERTDRAVSRADIEVAETFLGDPAAITELRMRHSLTGRTVTSCDVEPMAIGQVYLVTAWSPGPATVGMCSGTRRWNDDEAGLDALRDRRSRIERFDPVALERMRLRLSEFLTRLTPWPDQPRDSLAREVLMYARGYVRRFPDEPDALQIAAREVDSIRASPQEWSHGDRHAYTLEQSIELVRALGLTARTTARNEMFLLMPL